MFGLMMLDICLVEIKANVFLEPPVLCKGLQTEKIVYKTLKMQQTYHP